MIDLPRRAVHHRTQDRILPNDLVVVGHRLMLATGRVLPLLRVDVLRHRLRELGRVFDNLLLPRLAATIAIDEDAKPRHDQKPKMWAALYGTKRVDAPKLLEPKWLRTYNDNNYIYIVKTVSCIVVDQALR